MRGADDEVIPLHPPFETVLRGFHREQVVEHIEALEARIAIAEADRVAALEQVSELSRVLEHLRREAEEATSRLELMQRSSLGGAGVRIQRMMQRVEDEIGELRAGAYRESAELREQSRAEADRMLRETTERCARMEAEAGSRMQDYQARCLAGLHALLILAGRDLDVRTGEVRAEVAELSAVQEELTSRLSSVHRTLVAALEQIPVPAVPPEPAGTDTETEPDEDGRRCVDQPEVRAAEGERLG